MDDRLARRDAHPSVAVGVAAGGGSRGDGSPQTRRPLTAAAAAAAPAAAQTANLASANIPVDHAGNPLPWSKESVLEWARNNGFSKFVPAFAQHGIEGYRFYTLKLETMRGMKIPGVAMQDLIQLNAAIYRLNVACASPANRSHMTGTVHVPQSGYRRPASASNSQQPSSPQHPPLPQHRPPLPPPLHLPPILHQPPLPPILHQPPLPPVLHQPPLPPPQHQPAPERPSQPLRPSRPSWTVRHDDPQPTYKHQVQPTSNEAVSHPARPNPPHQQRGTVPSPVAGPTESQTPGPGASVQPLDPALQLQNVQRTNGQQPQVPFSINTGVLTGDPDVVLTLATSGGSSSTNHGQGSATTGAVRNARAWVSRTGPSPQSPYRDSPTTGERSARYGTVSSTYRSCNSGHVEIDELPFVRPTPAAWKGQQQQQPRPSPGYSATIATSKVHRRSAVIEAFDGLPRGDGTGTAHGQAPGSGAAQRDIGVAAAQDKSGQSLPARYHGTNHPHSPYYAHGSATTKALGGRTGGGAAARGPPETMGPPRPRNAPLGTAKQPSNEPGRYQTTPTYQGAVRVPKTRNGAGGALAPPPAAGTLVAPGPEAAKAPAQAGKVGEVPDARGKETIRMRRLSISPVLNALQPGNYHIANLPDDLDDSSDVTGSSSGDEGGSNGAGSRAPPPPPPPPPPPLPPPPPPYTQPRQSQQHQKQVQMLQQKIHDIRPTGLLLTRAGLPAINTTAFYNDLIASPCLTGESIVTPLSVVNVLPGMLSSSTSPSQASMRSQASHLADSMASIDRSSNRAMLQRAFGDDLDDLTPGASRMSHARTPSMPVCLESFPMFRGPVGYNVARVGAHSSRPRSSGGQLDAAECLDGDAQSLAVFDAESLPSNVDIADGPDVDAPHYDLVENAMATSDVESMGGDSTNSGLCIEGELSMWDADELDDCEVEGVVVFDAEEILDDVDDCRSSVVIDAYEVESIISRDSQAPDADSVHDEVSALPVPLLSAPDGAHNDAATSNAAGQSTEGALAPGDLAQQQDQQSHAFRLKGVRHVVSYGSDFDKTAATLLSSIKTDIAKKVAASTAAGRAHRPATPDVAQIAAAIEHHQQRQQHMVSPGSAERYTSRLSGLFGFVGQRSQTRNHPTMSPSPDTQPQADMNGGATASLGLRVDTDFHSLHGNNQPMTVGGNGAGTADAGATTVSPSGDGRTSASPSTLSRRWRVPFRQRQPAAAAAAVTADAAADMGACTEGEQHIAAGSQQQAVLRRNRDRAGTTSDIEPQRARMVARLNDAERPHSMVESSSSGSNSEATTPATAAMTLSPETGGPQLPEPRLTMRQSREAGLPPGTPLVGQVFRGRRRSTLITAAEDSPVPATVLARWENEGEFRSVSISGLLNGTSVAERVATTLVSPNTSPTTAHGPSSTPPSLQHLSQRLPGGLRFGVQMADGTQHRLLSASELWMHCIRARADTPAMFILYRGAGDSGDDDGETTPGVGLIESAGLGLPTLSTHGFNFGANWMEESDGGESEICSAFPVSRPFSAGSVMAESPRTPGTGDVDTASASSFVTARSGIAQARGTELANVACRSADNGGYTSGGEVAEPGSSPAQGLDSWTLMFFNQEFVVPQGSGSGSSYSIGGGSSAGIGTASGLPSQTTLVSVGAGDCSPSHSPMVAVADGSQAHGDDDVPMTAVETGRPATAQSNGDCDVKVDRSRSLRSLPSTMSFTRGMRATLLKRPSKRNIRERPTADVIGEQLDKYFPNHDLDRHIVQVVPVDEGLLPSQEFHIILDEEDGGAAIPPVHDLSKYTMSGGVDGAVPAAGGGQDDDTASVVLGEDGAGPPDKDAAGIGRRKSVRMLVQETRWRRLQRRHQRRRAGGTADEHEYAAEHMQPPCVDRQQQHKPKPLQQPGSVGRLMAANDDGGGHTAQRQPPDTARPMTAAGPAVVRRKSTKLWGCIPEEIQPRTRYAAGHSANYASVPRTHAWNKSVGQQQQQPKQTAGIAATVSESRCGTNMDIVRRALSLLRKPEPNPQAEREIVEAAMRSGDSIRVAGSTRAQFVHERALQRAAEAVGAAADAEGSLGDSSGSVNDAVRSLFAKYGLGPAGVRFQWIKGRLIGRGSFGHVHVAINAGTGEVIAVKQIRLPKTLWAAEPGKQQLSESVRMMYTEVELLRDLDHENIVQLLGFEVSGGLMSMFLEYVPGGTVQSLVQQHGPLHESVVHSFLGQVVAGLGYLHERKILHRDIKGANILVDETGTCRISDFGISRKVDHTCLAEAMSEQPPGGSSSAHRRRRILGTVPFMAPEVARRSEYTAAADIWSLGCVAVQMWSGRQPWDELQEPQVFFKLGRSEAPPIPDDLTEAGIVFCTNCFAADPEQRWTASRLAQLQFAQVVGDYDYPYGGK